MYITESNNEWRGHHSSINQLLWALGLVVSSLFSLNIMVVKPKIEIKSISSIDSFNNQTKNFEPY
jgi:hypothetical protein